MSGPHDHAVEAARVGVRAQRVLGGQLAGRIRHGASGYAQRRHLDDAPHPRLRARIEQRAGHARVHRDDGAAPAVAQHADRVDHRVDAFEAGQPRRGVDVVDEVDDDVVGAARGGHAFDHAMAATAQFGARGAADEAARAADEHVHDATPFASTAPGACRRA